MSLTALMKREEARRIERLRRQIADRTYETDAKLAVAAERLAMALAVEADAEEQDAERWDGMS